MRLKVYRAAGIAEAMARVRAEMGPDALILTTRRVADGIEVTAALEPDEPPSPAPLRTGPDLEAALRFHGVPQALRARLLEGVLVPGLEATLPFAALKLDRDAAPLLFAGPPGAGKTLTVARLATRLVLGGEKPLVVTADGKRAGAAEQLAAFTRLLGLSLIIASHPVTLARALARRAEGAPVLIDAPGIDPFDPAQRAELGALADTVRATIVLVLPAGLDAEESADRRGIVRRSRRKRAGRDPHGSRAPHRQRARGRRGGPPGARRGGRRAGRRRRADRPHPRFPRRPPPRDGPALHAGAHRMTADPMPKAAAGRTVAIASGKGGVGKTWFSITLAHALARRGRRVLLFDGDLGLANVDIQLGLTPARDLGAVIAGQATLAQAVIRHPEGGFDLVAGRSGSGAFATMDPATLAAVLDALRALTPRYDTVLLDLGAGLDRSVRQLAAFADTLLVVATEEPTSLTDAYAVLKLHAADARSADARIVVNQVASRTGGERTYAALARASALFLKRTPMLAGIVRRDDRVKDAIRRQILLLLRHPTAHAAADVEAIARTLETSRASPPASHLELERAG